MSLLRRINQRQEELEDGAPEAPPAPDQLAGERWFYKVGSVLYATAITADGRFVIAGSRNGDLLFFDISGRLFWRAKVEGAIHQIALAEEAEAFVIGTLGGGNNAYLWHYNGHLLHTYATEGNTSGVAITPDASLVAVGSQDRHLYLYGPGGQLLAKREVGGPIRQVALTSDGGLVLAASEDQHVHAFDRAANPRWTFETGGSVWAGVRIAEETRRLVIGSNDGQVYCLDFDGVELWHFDTGGLVNQLAITPDASLCGVVGKSGTTYLLNERGNVLWEQSTGDNSYGLALSFDGRYTAFGSHDGSLLLMDRQQPRRILLNNKLSGRVWSIAMTPDGEFLAAASADQVLHVFENAVARQDQSALFRPDSRLLVQLVMQQIRQDFASSPNLGLVRWFSEFERSLRHAQFDVCRALLTDANETNSLGLSESEQQYTHSLEGAYWLFRGVAFHRLQRWDDARECYERSKAIQESVNNQDGVGQVVAVLSALPPVESSTEAELAEDDESPLVVSPDDLQLLDEILSRPRVLGSSEKLLERRLKDASPDEQFQIVVLARHQGFLAPLLQALTAEERVIRAAASAALTYLTPGPGPETLETMLAAPQPFVRWQALRMLRQQVTDNAEEFTTIKEQLWPAVLATEGARSPDPLVRREEAQLVGEAGGVEDSAWLVERFRDPDIDVQIAVIEAMGLVADRSALPLLRQRPNKTGFLGANARKSADEAVAAIEQRFPTPTLERIILCDADPLENAAIQQSSLFMTGTGNVYCVVLVGHAPPNLQVTARWSHNDQVLKEETRRSLEGTERQLAEVHETVIGTDPSRRPFGRFSRPPVQAPDDFYDDDLEEEESPALPTFGRRSPFDRSSSERPASPPLGSRPGSSPFGQGPSRRPSPFGGTRPPAPAPRFGSPPPAPPDLLENTGPAGDGDDLDAPAPARPEPPGGLFRSRPSASGPPLPPRPSAPNPFSRPNPPAPGTRPTFGGFGSSRPPGSSPFAPRPGQGDRAPRPSPFGRPASPFALSSPERQFVFELARPEQGWQPDGYQLDISLGAEVTQRIDLQFIDRIGIARLEPGVVVAPPGSRRGAPSFAGSHVFLTSTSPIACQVHFKEAPVNLEVTGKLFSVATGTLLGDSTALTDKQGYQTVSLSWENPGWRPGLYRVVVSAEHSSEVSTEIELIPRLNIQEITLCHRVDEDQGPIGIGWPFYPGDSCYCVVEFGAAPAGITVQAGLYAKDEPAPLVQAAPHITTAGGEQRAVFALRDGQTDPLRPGHYAVVIRGDDVVRQERSFEVLPHPRWQAMGRAARGAGQKAWEFIKEHYVQYVLRELGAVILLALAFLIVNEGMKEVFDSGQRSRDVMLSAGFAAGQPNVWWGLGWLVLGIGYGVLRTRKTQDLSHPAEAKVYPVVNALLIFISSTLAWFLLSHGTFAVGHVRPDVLWGMFDQLRWLAPVVAWIAPAAGFWLAVKYQDDKRPDVFYTAPVLAGAAVLGLILAGYAGAVIVGLPLGLLAGIVGAALDLIGLSNALGRAGLGAAASLGFVIGPAAAVAIYFREELTRTWDAWQAAKKETPRLSLLDHLIKEESIPLDQGQLRQTVEWSGWVLALMVVAGILLLALFDPVIAPVLEWFYGGRASLESTLSVSRLIPVLALALILVWPVLVYACSRVIRLADLKLSEIEVTRRLAWGVAGVAALAPPIIAFASRTAFGEHAPVEMVIFWTNRLTVLCLALALIGWYLFHRWKGPVSIREELDLGDLTVEDVAALIVAVLAGVLLPVWMWSLSAFVTLAMVTGGIYLLGRIR